MRYLLVLIALVGAGSSRAQPHDAEFIDAGRKAADLAMLDSLVLGFMEELPMTLERLEARNAVLDAWDDSLTSSVDWACKLHGWLRSANDAHLRVAFEARDEARCDVAPPPPLALLAGGGPWERFGPGPGVPESAGAAWLARTWPWVGALSTCPTGSEEAKEEATGGPDLEAGMALTFHGTHVVWHMASFGMGSDEEFRASFKRMVREIRKSGLPIVLDLRGNLGGFRSRRHAVLSAFVPCQEWPGEWERPWGGNEMQEEAVEPMPLFEVKQPLDARMAVLVDGLSFSASLLLTDALLHAGRARVFGCAPLGRPGGCSGSPETHVLPGSGWQVEVPTSETRLEVDSGPGYLLEGGWECQSGNRTGIEAIQWLLSPSAVRSE